MFQKAKNIDTAFRQVRSFSILVVLGMLLFTVFITYKSFKLATGMESRIYVLANGKALEAVAMDRKENIPVEARDHIRMFHQYFFSLDPDEKVIQANITRALYLADGSARSVY